MKSFGNVFNNGAVIAKGWYWALPSTKLKQGHVAKVSLLSREIILARDEEGLVSGFDAHCPHMGAHLVDARVERGEIVCPYHGRRFKMGLKQCDQGLHRYQPFEQYGMIWLHSSDLFKESSSDKIPAPPQFHDLTGVETVAVSGRPERRLCHPTIILGSGVDQEHFAYVHRETTEATGPLQFQWKETEHQGGKRIRFENNAPIRSRSPRREKMLRLLHGRVLTYNVTYVGASMALAEFGPKWFRLYSIFAYRPVSPKGFGRTSKPTDTGVEAQACNLFITHRRWSRWGPLNRLLQLMALRITRKLLEKGGREDAVIQNKIRFRFGEGSLSDPAFSAFVDYVENLPCHTTPVVGVSHGVD